MCMQAGRWKSNRMPTRYEDRIQIMETGDRGQIHMPIPARVHFCWIGPQLSWAYAFALLSAAAQAGMDEGGTHPTAVLEGGALLTPLRGSPWPRPARVHARARPAQARGPLCLP